LPKPAELVLPLITDIKNYIKGFRRKHDVPEIYFSQKRTFYDSTMLAFLFDKINSPDIK